MIREFITALRTLTIIRLPGKDCINLADCLFFFPVVGCVVGLTMVLTSWGIGEQLGWPLGAGILCVAVSTILTGALHLDGLADVFDSFGGQDREQRLAIMKDPHIGSFGVIAVVICLLLKFVCIARISQCGHHWFLVLPYVISRSAQVQAAVFLPYVGSGKSAAQSIVEGASARHFWSAGAIAALLCMAFGGWFGLALLGAAYGTAFILGKWMKSRFSGVTGDLLGMTSELVEILLLVALAITAGKFYGISGLL